jgi:hypothetical protein
MQHSAVDLETYARLYTEDRLRVATERRRAAEVVTGASLLERTVARVQSWFTTAPQERDVSAPVAPQPAQLVPVSKKPQPASADPYAGMIVLVRGPKEPCTLDAA